MRRFLAYDHPTRRLWILGQRCHHGATGSVVAAVACCVLVAERSGRSPLIALAATGGILMAHDWKDHSVWFRRGS
jgi:hypothetical protein